MIDLNLAREALSAIPPNLPRDQWHEVGRAAISAGLSLDDIDAWSAPAENYKGRKDVEAAFRTITADGGTSAGTLIHKAKHYGFMDSDNVRSALPNAELKPAKQTTNVSAFDVWEQCIAATPAEPYIYRKQGGPDGLRVYPASAPPMLIRGQNMAGSLVVPCWSKGKLQTLQFIPLDKGDKLNLPGASFNDGFFTVGKNTDRIILVEGIGQAWAVNKATGSAAIASFGAGRMPRVAKVLRDEYPSSHLVIVADRGKEADAEKIAADISGQFVEMPADKPSNYDANDYALEFGTDALSDLLERCKTPAMRFNLLSGAELCDLAQMRWRVRGLLPEEGLVAVYGPSGSGKSFLILDMGCAVADGTAWFDRRVIQASVTYVCLEGEAGFRKRVKAWSVHHNAPLPDTMRFITQSFDMLSDDVPELAKAIIAGGGAGGMVIIDTLNRAAPGADENSSVDMGRLIAAAKQLQSLICGLVLLVHHTGKDQTKGLRGHSSLYAALDGAIEVIATDTRRAWSVAKSKDDVTGDSYPFKLKVIAVGTDDEGEEISSCVVVPDESPEAIKHKRPSLGKNQKIARDVLGEPFRKSSHIGMEGAPATRPCIYYSEAVKLVAERMPTDAKHQTESAKRAISSLVANGYLGMKGDWLWDC